MSHLFDLDGRVALITGSTRGIGKAIAEAMAESGAKVVISSRKQAACESVARDIEAAGGAALAVPCNVSRHDELRSLVDRTLQTWGQIDVLVCNAAVNPYFGPLTEISDSAYDKTLDTNVKNVVRLAGLVIPGMAERGGGAVIIVSSIAGLKGTKSLGAYAISKAADMQIARNLALEWGHVGIRVNCIAPGLVRTDMARALWDDPQRYAAAMAAHPLGRIGEPIDIAGAAVFLASAAGRFVTGQTLVIDGGATIAGGQYS